MPFVEQGRATSASAKPAGPVRAGQKEESPGAFLFPSWAAARAEALRRRADPAWEGFVTRVVESPYGGYVVRSFPIDLFLDTGLSDPHGGTAVRYKDL